MMKFDLRAKQIHLAAVKAQVNSFPNQNMIHEVLENIMIY